MASDAQHAERAPVRRITLRNVQNCWVRVRAILAPIEPRMRVEYLQTAHEHEEYTQCVRPMQHASRNRVSIDGSGAGMVLLTAGCSDQSRVLELRYRVAKLFGHFNYQCTVLSPCRLVSKRNHVHCSVPSI